MASDSLPPPRSKKSSNPTPWIILGCCLGPIVLLGLLFVGCLGFSFYFAGKLGVGQMVQRQLEVERTSPTQARKKVDRSITLDSLYQNPKVGDGKWVEVEGYVLLSLEDQSSEFELGSPGTNAFTLVTFPLVPEELEQKREKGETIDPSKMVMVIYSPTQPSNSAIKLKNGDRVKVLGLASLLDLEFMKSWLGKELEKEGKLPSSSERGVKFKRTGPPKMLIIYAKVVEKLSP